MKLKKAKKKKMHELRITKDGSHTIYIPELNEHYHSMHGAYTESMHVYINAGLKKKLEECPDQINILEVGLGTGLNVLLTLLELQNTKTEIYYTALEPHPLPEKIWTQLNYTEIIGGNSVREWFEKIHRANFNTEIQLSDNFTLLKKNQKSEHSTSDIKFDIIYFDAFAPDVQPELWTKENLKKIFDAMRPRGIFVTYCSKGEVRRNLISAGFLIEKLPGAPGKREMLRATKNT